MEETFLSFSFNRLLAALPEFPELRANEPPIDPGMPYQDLRLASLIGVVVLILAVALWLWRRTLQPARFPELPLSAETAAQRQLSALQGRASQLSSKEFADELSGVVRHYLQQEHGVLTAVQTTVELFPQSGPPALPSVGLFESLLRRCDVMKFGGQAVLSVEQQSLIEQAGNLIRQASQPLAMAVRGAAEVPVNVAAEAPVTGAAELPVKGAVEVAATAAAVPPVAAVPAGPEDLSELSAVAPLADEEAVSQVTSGYTIT